MLSLLWLAVLTPFVFLTYGFTNWVSSLRHDVPSLAFAWQHHIPFLAWTIVPYWSTDLFYAGALFLCRTRRELLHPRKEVDRDPVTLRLRLPDCSSSVQF
jgi:hypothetical protein